MAASEPVTSPWSRGRLDGRPLPATLLFGRMHEDWTIETSVFAPGSRVFCIASAGCTAMALAGRGFRVTAVDINPAQVEYVQKRLAGAPLAAGQVEKLWERARRAMRWLGWPERTLRAFLELDAPDDQIRFWREHLDTARLRVALGTALHPWLLRLVYPADFVQAVPRIFALVLRRRLERGWATHPNRTNPYAWEMLLGCEPPSSVPIASASIALVCADAAQFLEDCPAESFDGLTLSNILDGTGSDYRERLLRAVRRAAAPGALLVLRSFAEPENEDADRRARQDRALIWGSLRVERVGG